MSVFLNQISFNEKSKENGDFEGKKKNLVVSNRRKYQIVLFCETVPRQRNKKKELKYISERLQPLYELYNSLVEIYTEREDLL